MYDKLRYSISFPESTSIGRTAPNNPTDDNNKMTFTTHRGQSHLKNSRVYLYVYRILVSVVLLPFKKPFISACKLCKRIPRIEP